jgi:enoyl-[acyl-carrier protein] reductase I
MVEFSARPLAGKKEIILGIANEHSITYGCAQAFRGLGADIALTYSDEKAKPYVERLAKASRHFFFLPCDVRVPEQLENVFEVIGKTWGKLDFALHSIASAPKQDLHSPLSQCSRDGFLQAMDVSCYSFIRMAHLAAPMMPDGGTILTMKYYGAAEKVIENYNVMGTVFGKFSSLSRLRVRTEAHSCARDLSRADKNPRGFGDRTFRRTAGARVAQRAPERDLVSIEDVGATTAFLATDYAKLMTGEIMCVAGGYHIVG